MGPYLWCQVHNVWLTVDDVPGHITIKPTVGCRLVDTVAGLDVLDDMWQSIPLARRLSTVVGP